MRIDGEEFRKAMEYRRSVNAAPLEQIEIYDGGVKVEIAAEDVEFWNAVGLSNWDFVKMMLGEDPGITVMTFRRDVAAYHETDAPASGG